MKAIRLLKPHRHAGKPYAAGTTLAGLTPALANWLVTNGVGEMVDANEGTRTGAPIRRKSCCGGRW